jgi:hypothetical protein
VGKISRSHKWLFLNKDNRQVEWERFLKLSLLTQWRDSRDGDEGCRNEDQSAILVLWSGGGVVEAANDCEEACREQAPFYYHSGGLDTCQQRLQLLQTMGEATIHHHTFFHNQEAHVEPSVLSLWKREQDAVIQSLTRSVLLSRESTRLIHSQCCWAENQPDW